MKDYYAILGIEKNASENDVKKAYHKLALKNHPDKGGDESIFKEITEANEILSNSESRRQYDLGEDTNNIGINIFDHFFGGQFKNHTKLKRNSHVHQIKISLRDVYTGIDKKLKVSIKTECVSCKSICKNCNGKGIINIMNGPFIMQQNCNACSSGYIKVININCNNCVGKGFTLEDKMCNINVPIGIISGTNIKINGFGEQARNNNEESGDLLFQIIVEDDPYFKRNGNDLIFKVSLTFKESIIGKNFKIPHFSGQIELNSDGFGVINPLKEYSLKEKGILNGNLILNFQIEYPNNKYDKDLLLEFKNMNF